MNLHCFLLLSKSFSNIFVVTAARRHNETEAESQARYARNSQVLYTLDVLARVF